MSGMMELDPVERITVGAVGPPGERTFYLQARGEGSLVTLILEKEQVIALGRGSEELLSRVGYPEPPMPWDEQSMSLEEPLEPAFRVGAMAMGFIEDRDQIVIECREEAQGEDPSVARFWLSKAQLGALGQHGLTLGAKGRPVCRFCGLPMDPAGHECYARNGHRKDADA